MILFGVDYYPEHWPSERWPKDIELMSQAHVNVVRLAEFAWSRLEPTPNQFDLDWLDCVLDLLQASGIKAILGTPTAAPPVWLLQEQPSIFAVREDRTPYTFGNRCFCCPTSPEYRLAVRRLVETLAKHYADHPAVIGWQIDNEFHTRCFCETCRRTFHSWLGQRYGDLEKVNTSWGTVFWSQEYSDWEQIPLPWTTGGSPNPGLGLDFRRFTGEMYREFLVFQANILKSANPKWQITHNFMGFNVENLDYGLLARELDVVAWDNYPAGAPNPLRQAALGHAVTRGYGHQKPFWVMESQSGPGGRGCVGPDVRPGQMRQWAFHAFAHGANGVLFFRWRTCPFGTEQYWHGILNHDGVPRERYRELCRMGEEISRLGEAFENTRILPNIALVNDYQSRFALQIQPSSEGFSYAAHAARYFDAFYDTGHPVSIVTPADDVSPYSLVIVPALFVVEGDFAERLQRYVEEGGVAVATFRTGVKNRENQVFQEALPALMNNVFGIRVHHYESLRPGEERELRSTDWNPSPAPLQDWKGRTWCDLIERGEAEPMATYAEGAYEDSIAITRHHLGKGAAYYVGTEPNPALMSHLMNEWVQTASIPPGAILPEGIEMTCRQAGDERYIFLFNGCGEERSVPLSGSAQDILSGEEVCDSIIMEPYGVAILRDIGA